jgi:hypothetical protein
MLLVFPMNAQVTHDPEEVNDCTLALIQDMVKVSGDCDGDVKPHGHWVFNYRTGKKSVEGTYVHGRKTGVWSTWTKDGVLFSETTYSDTTTNYLVKIYWHDGQSPKSETTFDAAGKWLIQTDWDAQGRRSSYPNTR